MIQLAVSVVSVVFLMWLERKIKARSQFRVGPPVYQQLADLVKLFRKANIRNVLATPFLSTLPLVYLFSVCLLAFYMPFGGLAGGIDMITLVFFLALISMVYILSGFFSSSPYGFFGAKRELLLFISYELPFLLSIFSVGILYANFSLERMFAFSPFLIPAMAVFYLSMIAKLRRSPFDIPNATQEIIEGSATEFSGPSLAVFSFSEWVETFVLCSIFYALFIGIPDFFVQLLLVYGIFVSVVIVDVLTPRITINQAVSFFWKYVFPVSVAEVILCFLLTL